MYITVWYNEGKCDQTHDEVLITIEEVLHFNFRESCCQAAIYDWEWLIPIMTYMYLFLFIFSTIYYNITFLFYLQDVWLARHLGQCRRLTNSIPSLLSMHDDRRNKMCSVEISTCIRYNFWDWKILGPVILNLILHLYKTGSGWGCIEKRPFSYWITNWRPLLWNIIILLYYQCYSIVRFSMIVRQMGSMYLLFHRWPKLSENQWTIPLIVRINWLSVVTGIWQNWSTCTCRGIYIYKSLTSWCKIVSSQWLLPRPRRGLRGIVFTRSVCLSVCLSVCVCVCVCVCLSVYLCVRPIFWYFISRLLEEISIWNLYRILIGLYSIH